MSNMGRAGVNWNADNIQWINQWNNEALQNIVPQQGPYDATTTQAYYNWYRMSTRTRLTSEPPTMPTYPTHMEQLQRWIDTSSAYYRDSTIDICTEVQAMAREGMRAQGIDPKGRAFFKRISEFITTRIMRWGTENDVATRVYNIPEPRSARPSAAPSSSMRWGEGPSTTPTVPRHGSSLPLHGQTSQVHAPDLGSTLEQTHFMEQDAYTAYGTHTQGSQPYPPTQGIRMPEGTRWRETSEAAQSYNSGQEINGPSWGDEETHRGVHKEILTETHATQCTLPGMLNDFLGGTLLVHLISILSHSHSPTILNHHLNIDFRLHHLCMSHRHRNTRDSTAVVFVNTDPLIACHPPVVGKGQLVVVA
ncbi:uncharacterized protein LOC123429988 isoform X2 [Hordeum vulgare subsp. vulgare]|nr:uncharacterized protein LOC123429988 isoform X2 [Hordeum vulgare subsp. vulgare]